MGLCARTVVPASALVAIVSLGACAPGRVAHENFLESMQIQVGRDIANPNLMRNRYPERRVSTKVLQNGNTEEEFLDGIGLKCRVFFEIDNKTAKVVAWRYEGTQRYCAIVP
jgi:hypothetical protein